MSADELPAPPSPVRASADSSANEQGSRRPIRQPQYGYFDEDRKRAVYGWYDTREQVETPCESAEQFHAQPFASIPGKPVVPVAAASEDEFRPVRSAPRTSASRTTRAGRSELRPAKPSPDAEKPSVDSDKKTAAKVSPQKKAKPSGSGSATKPSGSGYALPELLNVQWEANAAGGWEAWHSPDGAFHRKDKTYLGHVGKRQLAAWSKLSPDDACAAVIAWIAEKRSAKGIAG